MAKNLGSDWSEKNHPREASGKFATKESPEARGGMDALATIDLTPALAARARVIADGGQLEAAALARDLHGASAKTWWETNLLLTTFSAGKSVPVMLDAQDDQATKTRLRRYSGGETEMRMPSAAAIKRFSAAAGDSTFDVPVSTNTPTGPVTGWVRVTKAGPGKWTTEALGFPAGAGPHVQEGVAAILEARRPTHALRDAGDLVARYEARKANQGVTISRVGSSVVQGAGYEDASASMIVKVGGEVRAYDVDRKVYEQVTGADRPGATFNKLVAQAPQRSVEQCRACGRFTSLEASHACPAGTVRASATPASTLSAQMAKIRARAAAAAGMKRTASSSTAKNAQAASIQLAASDILAGASRSVRGILARRGRQGWQDEADDRVSEVAEACLRAQRKGTDIGPGYVHAVAKSVCNPNRDVASSDRKAMKMVRALEAQITQSTGAPVTEAEFQELAQYVLATWEPGVRKPSRHFWRETTVHAVDMGDQATEVRLASHIATFDVESEAEAGSDKVFELQERVEQARGMGRGATYEARRDLWNTMANAYGAPEVVPGISKNRVTAARTVMGAKDGDMGVGVRKAIATHNLGENDEYTQALFAPFGPLDPHERDAVVEVFTKHPEYASDMWSQALASASNTHAVAA